MSCVYSSFGDKLIIFVLPQFDYFFVLVVVTDDVASAGDEVLT